MGLEHSDWKGSRKAVDPNVHLISISLRVKFQKHSDIDDRDLCCSLKSGSLIKNVRGERIKAPDKRIRKTQRYM